MAGESRVDKHGCPLPPMDHMRPHTTVAASAVMDSHGTFDRTGGNPGPQVVPFGKDFEKPPAGVHVEQEQQSQAGEAKETMQMLGEEPKTANDVIRQNALAKLVEIMPDIRENWILQCINVRIIEDKWDLPKTASWMLDYEHIAPRKQSERKFSADFDKANDYESIKGMLKDVRRDEPTPEYLFYSSLKLSQKFPQFSMYSLRKILMDLDYSYPMAVFSIVEGLEEVMKTEGQTWTDWKRHQLIEIKINRGKCCYVYNLCVVKGEKTWSKKKARCTLFPEQLVREVRLVEKALYFYEKRYRALKSKLDAERARRMQLDIAIKYGYACECPICYENYLQEEQVNCTAGHEFCVFCLNRSVDEAVNGQLTLSPEGNVPCLNQDCSGVFPLSALSHLLTGERMEKLQARLWTDFLARADLPNLFTCFGCGYAEQIDIPPKYLRVFQCKNPRCGRKWCRECRNLWDDHIGKSCKEMAGDPEEALRKKYDDLMSDAVIRKCWQCGRSLQKDQGCNKLKCQCGGAICYLCRKPITSYDHFCRHGTDPGQPCRSCSSCKLWEDPNKVDDALKAKLQIQLQEELFELKLSYAGKKTAGSTIATPKGPPGSAKQPQPPPPAPGPPPGQGAPAPQRQFAAIFG